VASTVIFSLARGSNKRKGIVPGRS
jgi:hypothetical protein